jgi:hypothetical protein
MHQTMTEKIINNRGIACLTISYPLSGTIGLHEPVVDSVYNWEEGDVPKIPYQETILSKEGLNESNMKSYCYFNIFVIIVLW